MSYNVKSRRYKVKFKKQKHHEDMTAQAVRNCGGFTPVKLQEKYTAQEAVAFLYQHKQDGGKIAATIDRMVQNGSIPCQAAAMYRRLQKFDPTDPIGVHPFGDTGRKQEVTDAQLQQIKRKHTGEHGNTLSRRKLQEEMTEAKKARWAKAGDSMVKFKPPCARTIDRAFQYLANCEGSLKVHKAMWKTSTRHTAETSMRAALQFAAVTLSSHLLPVDRPSGYHMDAIDSFMDSVNMPGIFPHPMMVSCTDDMKMYIKEVNGGGQKGYVIASSTYTDAATRAFYNLEQDFSGFQTVLGVRHSTHTHSLFNHQMPHLMFLNLCRIKTIPFNTTLACRNALRLASVFLTGTPPALDPANVHICCWGRVRSSIHHSWRDD